MHERMFRLNLLLGLPLLIAVVGISIGNMSITTAGIVLSIGGLARIFHLV